MKSISTVVLSFVVTLPLVAAHGFIHDMTIDGKNIMASPLNGDAVPSAIRQVFSQDPIKGAMNRDINCGPGAQPASMIADAMPGSELKFNWRTASNGNWPHNTGPMATYLASCGNVTCDKFDPINAKWFKIQDVGKKPGSDQWAQEDLMNGGQATVSLPKNLAPGNYIARHEIIALHLATNPGGAEFYAGCAQLRVGGNQKGVPDPKSLVSLPGAYSDNDPGIFDPNVFQPGAKYVFPGPDVAKFSAGGPTDGDNNTPPPPSNPGGGSCQLYMPGMQRPRALSRVMRNLRIH